MSKRSAAWMSCLAAACSALLLTGCAADAGAPRVTIRGQSWAVELATTPEQRRMGLAGRRLAPDAGMLFVFPDAQPRAFWMRGCVIDLDVAFLGSDLQVVKMHTMRVQRDPGPPVVYPSVYPARYALEVAAGSLAAAGVRVGDRAEFSPEVVSAAKGTVRPGR